MAIAYVSVSHKMPIRFSLITYFFQQAVCLFLVFLFIPIMDPRKVEQYEISYGKFTAYSAHIGATASRMYLLKTRDTKEWIIAN